ncbi:DUF5677 domain-containing protein [Streptomyces sp. NPDC056883]|uniref:DUF5677 domain-containing protein n=1 Tax=Streptomyces sp. NPDC056883 TaxID=3345959 RepID=UPI0036AFF181
MENLFSEYVINALETEGNPDVSEERVAEFAKGAVESFADTFGVKVAERVIRNRRAFSVNRRMSAGFDRKLKRHWGKAFSLFIMTQACCKEAGEKVLKKPTGALDENRRASLQALVEIHAKACRVTGEVLALLASGFPEGALARCRTLHEFAVTASVIGSCAGDPIHGDLGLRFLDHGIVAQLRNAKQYQEDYVALKVIPLEDGLLDRLEQRYREMLIKHGADFSRDYGWAKKYCPNDNFRALEDRAGMAHMRGYYQWASNEVHSGARGIDLNVHEFRGVRILRIGKTDAGFAEPASMAINSLYQVTASLVIQGFGDSDLVDLVTVKSLDTLRRKVSEEFADAEFKIREK